MVELNRKAKGKLYPVMLDMLRKRVAGQESQQPAIIPMPDYVPPQKPKPDVQWIWAGVRSLLLTLNAEPQGKPGGFAS